MSDDIVRKIGRYEIEREIGQGGMAIVYQALDPHLGRSVAIKLIKRDAFAPSCFGMILERFKREAMALARLDHPNIVKILDYGEHEGAPYLVMNYIVGTTLRDVRKPLRVETAVRLLRPIVEALDYVHAQGLVHRDIKPSNIMLTKQNHVILTDFGIAKWIDDDNEMATLTGTGVGIGTPEYMAPEQGRGSTLDGRSDLYSLSVIFYELITGVKPFTGATPVDILVRQATEPIPDPRTLVPEISPSIKRFLDRAMAKNPDDRYPTTADFLRDFDGLRLEAIAQAANSGTNPSGIRTIDRGSSAPSSGSSVQIKQSDVERVRQASAQTPETEPSRKKRTPWIAALVGLALVAAFVFGGLQLRSNRAREWEMATKTEAAQLSEPPALSQAEQLAVVKQTVQFETGLTQTQDALSNPSATPIPTDTVTMTPTPTASQTVTPTQDLTATQDVLNTATQQAVEKTFFYAQTQAQAQATTTEQARLAATEQAETQAAVYAIEQFATMGTRLLATSDYPSPTAEAINPTAEPNPYASLKIGDIVTFGHYEQDNDLENGKEPIEWEVLDVGKGSSVLISRYGLECLPYNDVDKKVTWEESSLNRFLQREFLDDTFSVDEQQYMLKSEIDSNGFYVTAEDDENGVDVFILGMEEVRFYFREGARQIEPTTYAAAKGAWTGTNGKVWWWIREDAKVGKAPAIGADGSIKDPGREVTYKGMVVRPVIRIRTPETVASEKEQLPPLSERLKDLKTGDRVLLGEFFQDTSYLNGTEPIEWRVLEVADGSALLLSEDLLMPKPYHEKWEGVTWEKSSLRRWLNEDFYKDVFTEEEKNVIALSELTNPRNPTYGTNGGNDTQDYVFLLSIDEVEKYLPTAELRMAKVTDYAVARGSWTNSDNGNGWWWLRSPGSIQLRASYVYSYGGVSYYGSTDSGSVRPALRIKLK